MRTLVFLALLSSCERSFDQTCPGVSIPADAIAVSTPPFLQVRRNALRLRFETPELVPVSVSLQVPGERCPVALTAETVRTTREAAWPEDPTLVEYPELPGDFTLHTATLEGLEPGVTYTWTVHSGPDADTSYAGQVRLPKAAGEAAVVGVMGSLAPPVQAQVAEAIGGTDLLVLAGDLTDTEPADGTYGQLAHDVFPNAFDGLLHTVAGDRDDTRESAYEEYYARWFHGQGRAGGGERHYSLDLAGVRVVVLDGEDERLSLDGGVQDRWLADELQDVAAQDELREAIVILHRGPYSLTERVPNSELRGHFMSRLAEAGVRLVISADGRAYERFEVDGMVIVNDGGGGSALGNPDHRIERDAEAVAARVVAEASHGGLRLSIAEDGAWSLERVGVDGVVSDTIERGPVE